jgi:hypothetical protein
VREQTFEPRMDGLAHLLPARADLLAQGIERDDVHHAALEQCRRDDHLDIETEGHTRPSLRTQALCRLNAALRIIA